MSNMIEGGLLILICSMTSVAEGMFVRKYNRRNQSGGMIFTALISLFSLLFFVITNTDGWYFPKGIFLYGILAGLLYCSASFLTFVALGCGSFTMSMLIISYSLLFPISYGVFVLKEELSVWMILGLAALMLSLFLMRQPQKDGEQKKTTLKWLLCIGAAFVGNGMFAVITRIQQIRYDNACSKEYMIIALSLSAVLLFLIGLFSGGGQLLEVLRTGTLWAALAGTANGVTNALGIMITMLIPISLSSPLRAGTKIMISFLVSVLLYREKMLKRQILGVIVGAAALVLLNIR